jgi:hypothetical protein
MGTYRTARKCVALLFFALMRESQTFLVYASSANAQSGSMMISCSSASRISTPILQGRTPYFHQPGPEPVFSASAAGSDKGADRWATVCSLITTAKLNDVEPFAYLEDVLERMSNGHPMSRLDDLLPWNWRPITTLN